jgi:sugar phosphate isomerase/epimerase
MFAHSQIAVQLYTLRDHCRTAPELAATLARVKAIGYDAVQISGVGPIPADEIRRICADAGLAICATHEPSKVIVEEPQKVIDRLGTLGCRYTAYPHPHWMPSNEAEVRRFADDLQRSGAALRKAGMVLCYHNHSQEFRKFGGKTMLDWIYDAGDPCDLQGEPDMYWVQAGGGNPVEWCARLYRRLPLLHLKDYGIDAENRPATFELGAGTLDFAAIISAAARSGCLWYIVEQDNCPGGDPFASIAQSRRHLVGLGAPIL